MNFRNKDLDWFSGKRTFIDGGVYMRFNGVKAQALLLLFSCAFAFSCGHQMFLLVRFVVSKQYYQKKRIYLYIYIYIYIYVYIYIYIYIKIYIYIYIYIYKDI